MYHRQLLLYLQVCYVMFLYENIRLIRFHRRILQSPYSCPIGHICTDCCCRQDLFFEAASCPNHTSNGIRHHLHLFWGTPDHLGGDILSVCHNCQELPSPHPYILVYGRIFLRCPKYEYIWNQYVSHHIQNAIQDRFSMSPLLLAAPHIHTAWHRPRHYAGMSCFPPHRIHRMQGLFLLPCFQGGGLLFPEYVRYARRIPRQVFFPHCR